MNALAAAGIIAGYLAGVIGTLCVIGDVKTRPTIIFFSGLLIGFIAGLLV